MSEESAANIKVVCRFRPLNQKELGMSDCLNVEFSEDFQTVSILTQAPEAARPPLKFTFDHVFPPDSTQVSVYNLAAQPIVDAVMQGFNGTVFAYGQTSSGKTFTMSGPDIEDPDAMGIIPRMVSTVFETIEQTDLAVEYSVKVAYAEIYLEKIRDLLDPTKINLKIHESHTRGVYIDGLTETYVSSEPEVFDLMALGASNREVGSTNMNQASSRSHSLFSIQVTQTNNADYSTKIGKLYLIDLAGSEKVGKTGAEGKRLEEAKNINKSLTVLGLVINSLTDGKSTHIPYRDSKLTRVLQDSLGGNSKTALIVTCSPSPYNEAETISSLRFGIRAKAIKNKPKINREYTVSELKLMLARAKEELQAKENLIRSLQASGPFPENQESTSTLFTEINPMDETIAELEEIRNRLSREVSDHMKTKKTLNDALNESKEVAEELSDFKKICEMQKEVLEGKTKKASEYKTAMETLKLEKDSLEKELEHLQSKVATSPAPQGLLDTGPSEETLASYENMVKELQRTNADLQSRLDEAYLGNIPDIEKLAACYQEQLKQERQSWENEKTVLLKSLDDRVRKVVNLQEVIYEMRDIEAKSSNQDLHTLAKENEAILIGYQKVQHHNELLRAKQKASEDRVQKITSKNASLEEQVRILEFRLEEAKTRVRELEESPSYYLRNIRKPIRGGPRDSLRRSIYIETDS